MANEGSFDLFIPGNASLIDLAKGPRFEHMDRHGAFYDDRQDRHKQYDWDGRINLWGNESSIVAGWHVPLRDRRPSTTMPLARIIVSRLTSMLFGDQNRPTVGVTGDEDATRFVTALANESSLWQRMVEARAIGGSTGTAALSYGFRDGKPRVEVHQAKFCRVIMWDDFPEKIPSVVLKAYEYTEEVFDPKTGKPKEEVFFYVRYWDFTHEVTWGRIPEKVARTRGWKQYPADSVIKHGVGECPVVWIQNTARSNADDGESDYENRCDDIDVINRLKSASSKGTIANVDPTLVIKSNPSNNHGSIRKGSENAIWSENGAEYLELRGDSIRAAEAKLDSLRQDILDSAQVILPTPEKITGAAQSAAALRLLFAPMTARCDVLREQYGNRGIVRVLMGLLRLAKRGTVDVSLEPYVESITDESGDTSSTVYDQTPGEREHVTLQWPPYFPPTWKDRQTAIQTTQSAINGQSVITRRTAIDSIASLFSIEDPHAELEALKREADETLLSEARMLSALTPGVTEDDDVDGDES